MSGDKNQTIICKPMQISKLPTNNFTNAFTIYKSIYKRHFQKWSAMLECKWIQEPLNQKKKNQFKKKNTKLNKARNIQNKTTKLLNKKCLKKNLPLFSYPNLALQVPICTWQEGGEYNTLTNSKSNKRWATTMQGVNNNTRKGEVNT
jgi:hypothetical protein